LAKLDRGGKSVADRRADDGRESFDRIQGVPYEIVIRRGWVGHCWITRKGDQPDL